MEKYHDLPDIDTNAPDVFETSDVESDLELSHHHSESSPTLEEDDSEIKHQQLNAETARTRFSHSLLVPQDGADFLGSVSYPKLGKSGYLIETTVETRQQKLARIARELEELKQEGENDVEKIFSENVDGLQTQLQEVLEKTVSGSNSKIRQLDVYSQRINHLFEAISSNIIKGEVYEKSAPQNEASFQKSSTSTSPSEILSLENRINELEKLIGVDMVQSLSSKPTGTTASLQSYVNDLSRKINIVHNPEYHIAAVKLEVELLIAKMDELETKRRIAEIRETTLGKPQQSISESTPLQKKIDDLYKNLPEFERANKLVPSVISRLKSLSVVHSDLAGCTQTVGELDSILGDLRDDMKRWDDSLNDVNAKIDNYETIFGENRKVVTAQIEELESKIDKVFK